MLYECGSYIILYLFTGDPEQNLPSLDPVRIPKISIHRTLQDIKVSGELIDLVAKNASSMILKTSKCV